MTEATGSDTLVREMHDLLSEFPQKDDAEKLAERFRSESDLLPCEEGPNVDEEPTDADDLDIS